jgi:Protein of unknown function (DUF3088)
MAQDILFLLAADFEDSGQSYYCRECAEIVGLLSYYQELHEQLDIRMVIDYPRPRRDIIEALGSDAPQNCPMLIAADASPVDGVNYIEVNGHKIVDGALQVGLYLSARFGIGGPHL